MAVKRKIKAKLNRLFGNQLLKAIEADNSFTFEGITLTIPAGVFHPRYFSSSKLLMQLMLSEPVEGKLVLELGCGSGITSFIADKRGAKVTATDISQLAIDNLLENQKKNNTSFAGIQSDLFDRLPNEHFDYILINPPYYPRSPKSDKEHAWYCGEDFDYFRKLFAQLATRKIKSGVHMTLSNDCELEQIKGIAKAYGYEFRELVQDKNLSEINYLYEVVAD